MDKDQNTRALSLGERIVRTEFNVAEGQTHNEVASIKNTYAQLINEVEVIGERDPRLASIVKTKLEELAMWHVKLVTAKN